MIPCIDLAFCREPQQIIVQYYFYLLVSKMNESKSAKNHETTAFLQWRRQLNLSISEAAVLLDKTRTMIRYLDRGITHDGRRVIPQRDTRRLMSAVAQGIDLAPWPI